MNPRYPIQFDSTGRTAPATSEQRARDLIEQVLFTAPGERVNRPTFGSGVRQLLFAPASPEVSGSTQFLVQGSLQQWLGDIIEVHEVRASVEDSILRVEVDYTIRRTQSRLVETFTKGAEA